MPPPPNFLSFVPLWALAVLLAASLLFSAGLAANLAGLVIPDWLEPTVSRIGASSIALGLMAAGAGLQLSSLASSKLLAASVLSTHYSWRFAGIAIENSMLGITAHPSTGGAAAG